MFTDLPLETLRQYTGAVKEPPDMVQFWEGTVGQARQFGINTRLQRLETSLQAIEVWDVTFLGWGGEPIKAWLRLPTGSNQPLPGVVQYQGYNGGRDHPLADLAWAAAGFAHLVMDNRGQGGQWSVGQTGDPHGAGPQVPGMVTKGIDSAENYYYRRLVTDAVRAVDALAGLEMVDPSRIGVTGGSQGGLLALAAAAWSGLVKAAEVRVPFLADVAHAVELTDLEPYGELVRYLGCQRPNQTSVFQVLNYFDAVNHARHAAAPALFSLGLLDAVTPASTGFAVFNNYLGPKQVTVHRFNGHEGGGWLDLAAALEFMKQL